MLRTIVIVSDEETAFTVDCRIATESEIAMWQQQKDERTLVSMIQNLYSPADVYEPAPEPVQQQPRYGATPFDSLLEEIRKLPSIKKVYFPAKLRDLLIQRLKPGHKAPYMTFHLEEHGYRLFTVALERKKSNTDPTFIQRKLNKMDNITFEFRYLLDWKNAVYADSSIFIPFV